MALSGVSETGSPQRPQKTFPVFVEEMRVFITTQSDMIAATSVIKEIKQITA